MNPSEMTDDELKVAFKEASTIVGTRPTCFRCGGAGGSQGWPGYTCYRCGGTGAHDTLYVYADETAMEAIKREIEGRKGERAALDMFSRLGERGWKIAALQAAALSGDDEAIAVQYPRHKTVKTILGGVVKRDLSSTEQLIDDAWSQYERRVEGKRKYQAKVNESKARDASSEFVGEPKTRTTIEDVTIEFMREFEGNYGPKTLIKFRTPDGDILVWWKSGTEFEFDKGDKIRLIATVVDHEVREGVKQTIVNRCRMVKPT